MYGGTAESFLGIPGFREHCNEALAIARWADPTIYAVVVMFKYVCIAAGVYLPDDTALRDTADALELAERSGEPVPLAAAWLARGVTLVHRGGPESTPGYDLLAKTRAMALSHQFPGVGVPIVDIHTAQRMARTTDIGGAIRAGPPVTSRMCLCLHAIYPAHGGGPQACVCIRS